MTNTTLRATTFPVTGQQRVYQEPQNRHWGLLRRVRRFSGRSGCERAVSGALGSSSVPASADRRHVRCYAAPVSESSVSETPDPGQDPAALAHSGGPAPRADGITGMYGLLAYAELIAFYRLSDATGSWHTSGRQGRAWPGWRWREFSHFDRIRAELERLGRRSRGQAMAPFTEAAGRLPRQDRAVGLARRWATWSRPTWGTGSRQTSTAPPPRCSNRARAPSYSKSWPTPATRSSRSSTCARPSRPTPRWRAGSRCCGPMLGSCGGGPRPGAAGYRRASAARGPAGRRRRKPAR